MKNWKTTTAGILTVLAAAINYLVLPYLGGHPVDLTHFIPVATGAAGLVLASDAAKPAQ